MPDCHPCLDRPVLVDDEAVVGDILTIGQTDTVNDFLVAYLDAVDESLLDYLDEEGELSLDTVHKLRLYATELLFGKISPAHLIEDWTDWFHLAPAFVAAYVPALSDVEGQTTLFQAAEESNDVEKVMLNPTDKTYLTVLISELDTYPERRDEAGE